MLTITIPALELYDEKNNLYINQDAVTLELEHSLVTLSRWESKWEKPFLNSEQKSTEETIDYIRCMTLTPNVPPELFNRLNSDHFEKINTYIDAKMSATWFSEPKTQTQSQGVRRKEIITAEIIYYWMIALQIPMECQNWHLNRLFTLVKVCNEKNNPTKPKTSRRDMVAERNRLNAERKAAMKTKG